MTRLQPPPPQPQQPQPQPPPHPQPQQHHNNCGNNRGALTAADAAASAAAAYPKWALPFAFVAFPPRLRRLAVRTTYLCTGRGTLPIVKGDFPLQRLALPERYIPIIILNTHVMHKGSRSTERLRALASRVLSHSRASTFAGKNLRHRDCEIVF